MKHTPAPWLAEGFEQMDGNGNFYGGLIVGADSEVIVAQCVAPHNANLIAAAPDLLEALEQCLPHVIDSWYEDHPAVVLAIAAIEKATGETWKN